MGIICRSIDIIQSITFPLKVKNRFVRATTVTLLLRMALPFPLPAQKGDIKFERLGREQGLTGSSITCILQDRQGFMWFGTHAGLNKYDGYGFTAYKHDVLDTHSLSGEDRKSVV